MWEAIVEKLLTRYLSQYVEGIERDNLHVGLLSGNIILNDLTIKPEAIDSFALPFSVITGRIGRLQISISWAKWMTQDYDLQVKVEQVHVLLKPRAASQEDSLHELRTQVRKAKEQQVLRREARVLDLLRAKHDSKGTSSDSGFLMKITNKLLKNMNIEIFDVHFSFYDVKRVFSIGCLLNYGAVFSQDGNGGNAPKLNSTLVSKVVKFDGLSIYGATREVPNWKDVISLPPEQQTLKQVKAAHLLEQIKLSLSLVTSKPSATNLASDSLSSDGLTFDAASNRYFGDFNDTDSSSKIYKEQSSSDESAFIPFTQFSHILLPLQLRFQFLSSSETKQVVATLDIDESSKGIVFSKSQLQTMVDLYNESEQFQRRCASILMVNAHRIRLDSEGFNSETKPLFSALYRRKLQTDYGIPGTRPLSPSESEMLTMLHDVVPVRHLAKWRAICVRDAEKLSLAGESKIQEQLQEALQQQSWWNWATQGRKSVEESVREKVRERGGAQTLLTSDEMDFMSNAVLTEISSGDGEHPITFNLSFNLPHFCLVLNEHSNKLSEGPLSLQSPFLSLELFRVNASFKITSSTDKNDKDTYDWTWSFVMAKFLVRHYGENIMAINQEIEGDQKPDSGLQEFRRAGSMPSETFSVEVETSGMPSRQKQRAPGNLAKIAADLAVKTYRRREGSGEFNQSLATVWELTHTVKPEGTVYAAFIRMSPLELFFDAALLRELLRFFVFETRRQVLTQNKVLEDNEGPASREVIPGSNDDFYGDVIENVEFWRTAANYSESPLLYADVIFCAPILYCRTPEGRGVEVHLGELKIQTEGYQRYSDISCSIEMIDTQISCIGPDGVSIPILRPVPIRVCLRYLPATSEVYLDIVFYELFIELTTEAVESLMAVQSSIIWSVIKSRLTTAASTTISSSSQPQASLTEGNSEMHLTMQDMEGLQTSGLSLAELNSFSEQIAEEAQATEPDTREEYSKEWNFYMQLFVTRVGFSLFNKNSEEALRAAIIHMMGSGAYGPESNEEVSIIFSSNTSIQFQGVFLSNPNTHSPLFLTTKGSDDYDLMERELFGDRHISSESTAFSESKPLKEITQETPVEDAQESPCQPYEKAPLTQSVDSQGYEDIVDGLKELEGYRSLEIQFKASPNPTVSVLAATCEVHWEKESVKQAIGAMNDLKTALLEAIESQMKQLRFNAEELINSAQSTMVDESGLTALETVLRYARDKLGASSLDNTPEVAETTSEELLIVPEQNESKAHGNIINTSCSPKTSLNPSIHVSIQSAAIFFWESGYAFAKGEIRTFSSCYSCSTNGDSEITLSLGGLHFNIEGRCILSSLGLQSRDCEQHLSDQQQQEHAKVLDALITFYSPSNAQSETSIPYSAQLKANVARLSYVYFQRDLIKVLNYLSDGIIDVLLWQSYEAAVSLATSSYFLFLIEIDNPTFILPEEKSIIPQLSQLVKLNHEGVDELPLCSTWAALKSTARDKRCTHLITTDYLGCFIKLTLGNLKIRNDYLPRPTSSSSVRRPFRIDLPLSKIESTVTATVFITMEGLSASMSHSQLYGFFSEDVSGPVLQEIFLRSKLRCGDPVLLDMHASEVRLSLRREQLTLLLDILNENFGGLGYSPTAIQLERDEALGRPQSSENQLLRSNNSCSANDSNISCVERETEKLINTLPLRVSVRASIDSFQLDAAFDSSQKFAHLSSTAISVACDVWLFSMYVTYRFNLVGEYVILNDLRQDSNNFYKRFLDCFPSTNEESLRTSTEAEQLKCYHINYGPSELYVEGEDLPGTFLPWLRPGAETTALMTNLTGPDDESQWEAASSNNRSNCLSISLENSVLRTLFCVELDNPTVYVFIVGMQDILDWVLSSFCHSTLRRFLKPAPAVVSSLTKEESLTHNLSVQSRMEAMIPTEKPFLIDVSTEPIIQWQSKLKFLAEINEAAFLFQEIGISDCRILKVDIQPPEKNQRPPLRHSMTSINSCDKLQFSRPSLFSTRSHVTLCNEFSLMASGALNSNEAKGRGAVHHDFGMAHEEDLCRAALAFITPQDEPKYDRDSISKSTAELSRTFSLSLPSKQPSFKTELQTVPAPLSSHLQLQFDISDFFLNVSSRDLAVLLSAFQSLNTDTPAASPQVPYPPIIPAFGSLQSNDSVQNNITLKKEDGSFVLGPKSSLGAWLSNFGDPLALESGPDSGRGSQTIQWPPNEPLLSRAESLAAEKADFRESVEVLRFYDLNFQSIGINLTIFDECHSNMSPVLQTRVSADKVQLNMEPKKLVVTVASFQTSMSYMSPMAGVWEPFVEKFNIGLTFAVHYKAPYIDLPSLRQMETAARNTEGQSSDASRQPATSLSLQKRGAISKPQPTAETTMEASHHGKSKDIVAPKLSGEWLRFKPDVIINIASGTPLWINVTPQLCRLLMWFIPTLTGDITASSLAISERQLRSGDLHLRTSESLQADEEPKFEFSLGSSLETQNLAALQENIDSTDASTSSPYRYVNLTGSLFVGFFLDKGGSIEGTKSAPEISSAVYLVPTVKPKSLGALANALDHQNVKREELHSLCVYIANIPPIEVVKKLQATLPGVTSDIIIRNLMVTRDPERTYKILARIHGALETSGRCVDPTPPFIGPFPKSMLVHILPLSKTSAVLLPPSIMTDSFETNHPESNSERQEESPISVSKEEDNSDPYEEAGFVKTASNQSSPALLEKHVATQAPVKSASEFAFATSEPICFAGHLASVIAPHPSYKLCIITSCIRIRNRSGMALEIMFLRKDKTPIFLSNVRLCCAPCSLLEADGSQYLGPTHSSSFTEQHDTKNQLQPLTQCQSCHPALHVQPHDLHMETLNRFGRGFSVVVPDSHFLSVPQSAFLGELRVIFSFRPAALRDASDSHARSSSEPFSMNRDLGWSAAIDTIDVRDFEKNQRHLRSCQFSPGLSSMQATKNNEQYLGTSASFFARSPSGILNQKKDELFYTILQSSYVSSLPAEQRIIELTVYPSKTIVNACPVPIDVELVMELRTQPIATTSTTARPLPSPSYLSGMYQAVPKQQEPLVFTVMPFSTFYIYSTPPVSVGVTANLRLRCGFTDTVEWSSVLKFIQPPAKEDVVARLMLPFPGRAKFEVEVYQDPCDFASSLKTAEAGQQACVLSCPRWLIDQTGFEVAVTKTGSSKLFPYFNGITLLGDSHEPTVELIFKKKSSKEKIRVYRGFAEIPAVGRATEFAIDTGAKYYTFILQASKINTTDTGGALSRCITLVPKFMLSNKLNDKDLFVRQSKVLGAVTCVRVGKTEPLYWTARKERLMFEFRPGETSGYSWSGPILPCEAFVGGNNIAIFNGIKSCADIFNVQIIPSNGVICVVIRSLDEYPEVCGHSTILTNYLPQTSVQLRAFHPAHTSDHYFAGSDVRTPPSAELDVAFVALPGKSVTVAWPWPFTERFLTAALSLITDEQQTRCHKMITLAASRRYRNQISFPRTSSYSKSPIIQIVSQGNLLLIDVLPAEVASSSRRISQRFEAHSEQAFISPAIRPSTKPQDGACDDEQTSLAYEEVYPARNIQLTVNLSQIGLSVVSDRRREELLFAEVTQFLCVFLKKDEDQLIEVRLSEVQVDSQLEESTTQVLLANRGSATNGHSSSSSPVPPLTIWDQIPTLSNISSFQQEVNSVPGPLGSFHDFETSSEKRETLIKPIEDLASPRPPYFLYAWIERESCSSSDLHLKKVLLVLDDIELDIDSEILEGIVGFTDECLDCFGLSRPSGIPRSLVFQRALALAHANFEPPVPGQVVILDDIFLLDKVAFLSDVLKIGLRILMVSQKLELKGAPIGFDTELVDQTQRGSLFSLFSLVKGRYLNQALRSIGVVLGYSSLATLPRAPLDIMRGTLGLGLTVADNLSSGIGSIISNLTFDAEYINERQKNRIANPKGPHGVKEGILLAGKDFKEGFRYLGDIITQPIGGAQKEGFVGFVKGLGKGLVGSIVKPVDKFGQVVSTMASGLRAEYVTRPRGGYKLRNVRRRKPRMLWGDGGQIREYDASEARLRECLGLKMAQNILQSVTISLREFNPPQHLALLIYPKKLCYVDLYAGRGRLEQAEGRREDSSYSTRATGRAKIIWTLNLTEIVQLRAASHGLVIHTKARAFQVPCIKGALIQRLNEEIQKARHRVRASIQIRKLFEHSSDDP